MRPDTYNAGGRGDVDDGWQFVTTALVSFVPPPSRPCRIALAGRTVGGETADSYTHERDRLAGGVRSIEISPLPLRRVGGRSYACGLRGCNLAAETSCRV